ncbi:hypothetical protein OH77DRAFT_458052 [Trametes cingulata]|nr:hypothetical protein OH77DRAFT_458052 [Trametes cingulata]
MVARRPLSARRDATRDVIGTSISSPAELIRGSSCLISVHFVLPLLRSQLGVFASVWFLLGTLHIEGSSTDLHPAVPNTSVNAIRSLASLGPYRHRWIRRTCASPITKGVFMD